MSRSPRTASSFCGFTRRSGNGHGGASWHVLREHIYRDEHGELHTRVRKLRKPDGSVTYAQAHWDSGQWMKGKPAGAKVPYRLPALLAAPLTTQVYITEGEKDADALANLGFVATCNSEGADNGKGSKWTHNLNEYFKDRHVCILPDNDHVGRTHAQHVARNLDLIAASVRVVKLPNLPPKGDVSDWLESDPTGARLVRECSRAALWEPTTAAARSSDNELIAELATLARLDYAKRRADAAEQIGIGVVELDKIVAEARGEAPPVTPERWAVEPWPEAVDTADLLQAVVETYGKHVFLPEHGAVAMALWCLHCWAIDAAYVSPFLMFTSPEMRCGKSRALSLLFRTGPRTSFAANISSASVFRYIDACHPVLLIDEADTFTGDNEQLRGILNSGHSRDTAFVIRCEGDDNTPREFSTWSAKAIAAIGTLAATLRDRSIILPMRRKKAGEHVAKLRAQDGEPFVSLRRKAARWATDAIGELKAAKLEIPDALDDRAQDNWEALLQIAQIAGGDWPKLARDAALSLTGTEIEDATLGVQLLAATKSAFEALGDRFSSEALVAELIKGPDKPWATYNKGKPISQRQVARLLKPFAIGPETVRIGERTPRGYDLCRFADAFSRYLVPPGGSIRNSATSLLPQPLLAPPHPQHPTQMLRIENARNPITTGVVAVLRIKTPYSAK
jgi:putative DNA primase/helicase